VVLVDDHAVDEGLNVAREDSIAKEPGERQWFLDGKTGTFFAQVVPHLLRLGAGRYLAKQPFNRGKVQGKALLGCA